MSTFDDGLLAHIGDTKRPLAQRLAAAQEVERQLRHELERRCEEVFPDFYWAHSDACSVEESDYETVRFPQARKMQPDARLTSNRDKMLRELGFAYLGDQRLGLVTASEVGQ